jgi:hypothetical protein
MQLWLSKVTPRDGWYVGVETIRSGEDTQRKAQVLDTTRHRTDDRHQAELPDRIDEEHVAQGNAVLRGTHPVDAAVVGRFAIWRLETLLISDKLGRSVPSSLIDSTAWRTTRHSRGQSSIVFAA